MAPYKCNRTSNLHKKGQWRSGHSKDAFCCTRVTPLLCTLLTRYFPAPFAGVKWHTQAFLFHPCWAPQQLQRKNSWVLSADQALIWAHNLGLSLPCPRLSLAAIPTISTARTRYPFIPGQWVTHWSAGELKAAPNTSRRLKRGKIGLAGLDTTAGNLFCLNWP